jgi:hypothetical protein
MRGVGRGPCRRPELPKGALTARRQRAPGSWPRAKPAHGRSEESAGAGQRQQERPGAKLRDAPVVDGQDLLLAEQTCYWTVTTTWSDKVPFS